jgi:hypothetical protein
MSGAFLVQCIVCLAASWLVGPIVILCLWPRTVRVSFEAGPDAIGALTSRAAQDVIAALTELGFGPIGVKVEKPLFRTAIRELSFVARDRRCYGAVASGSRPRLYFYTPFPDGGLVLTSNGAFPKIKAATVVQQSFPGCGPQDLLGRHHEALASLGRNGEVSPTPESRIAATHHYYATPEVRRALGRIAAVLLFWMVVLGWILARR